MKSLPSVTHGRVNIMCTVFFTAMLVLRYSRSLYCLSSLTNSSQENMPEQDKPVQIA